MGIRRVRPRHVGLVHEPGAVAAPGGDPVPEPRRAFLAEGRRRRALLRGPGRPASRSRPGGAARRRGSRGRAGPRLRDALAPSVAEAAAVGPPACALRPRLPVAVLRLAFRARVLGCPRPLLRALGPGPARPARLARQGPAGLHARGPGGGRRPRPRLLRRRTRSRPDPGRGRPRAPRLDGPVDRVARRRVLGPADDDRRAALDLPVPSRRLLGHGPSRKRARHRLDRRPGARGLRLRLPLGAALRARGGFRHERPLGRGPQPHLLLCRRAGPAAGPSRPAGRPGDRARASLRAAGALGLAGELRLREAAGRGIGEKPGRRAPRARGPGRGRPPAAARALRRLVLPGAGERP